MKTTWVLEEQAVTRNAMRALYYLQTLPTRLLAPADKVLTTLQLGCAAKKSSNFRQLIRVSLDLVRLLYEREKRTYTKSRCPRPTFGVTVGLSCSPRSLI